MKVAPLMEALRSVDDVEQVLVHTGQHYDSSMSDAFFADLELPYPDHFLAIGSGSHAAQTAGVMLALDTLLDDEAPDVVLVPGDVNSTLGAALAAVKKQIPVIHLEAGLRSWDRTMAEEHNRVLVDHAADLLLTPSRDADENLLREGIPPERIEFIGNVMIDSLRTHEARARELDLARAEFDVQGHLLVTLHRPAVVDDPDRLLEAMQTLEDVAEQCPVLFPVHPRTKGVLTTAGWNAGKVRLLEPQGYLRFLSLLCDARAVLTDSGGIQEETTVLGVPCFTLRDNTERPITVTEGTNTLLGTGPAGLAAFRSSLNGTNSLAPRKLPEGWDGAAAQRAADALIQRYG